MPESTGLENVFDGQWIRSYRKSVNNKKILTIHPTKRRGVIIGKYEYDLVRENILSILKQRKKVPFFELLQIVSVACTTIPNSSRAWCILMVKLDMEAKGEIKSEWSKFSAEQTIRLRRPRPILH